MGTKLGTTGTSTPHDSDMAYPPGMELHGSKWRIKKRVPQDLLRKHPDLYPSQFLTLKTDESDRRAAASRAWVWLGTLEEEFTRVRETGSKFKRVLPPGAADEIIHAAIRSALSADEESRQSGLDDFMFERLDSSIAARREREKRVIARGQIDAEAEDMAHEWLLASGYDLERSSTEFKQFAVEFFRRTQRATQTMQSRSEGEWVETPPALPAVTQKSEVPRLSRVIEYFISKQDSSVPMFKKYRPALDLFLEFMGDRPVDQIRQMDIENYFDLLCKLPPHWFDEKRTRKATAQELAAMEWDKCISYKTFKDGYLAAFRPFLSASTVTRFPGVQRRADSGIYQFGLRAPKDLQAHFPSGWAIRASLNTADLREANAKAKALQAEWSARFEALRTGKPCPIDIPVLKRRLFEQWQRAIARLDETYSRVPGKDRETRAHGLQCQIEELRQCLTEGVLPEWLEDGAKTYGDITAPEIVTEYGGHARRRHHRRSPTGQGTGAREQRAASSQRDIEAGQRVFRPGGARPPTQVLNDFIDKHRDTFGVEPVCKVLQVAPSAYRRHAALVREPHKRCARACRDEVLASQIQRLWQANMQVYGADKIWRQLAREGVTVARCTVERLMRRLGLRGVMRGKVVRTTISDSKAPCPLDRVNRQFKADRPNQLWVSDFTYVSTWQGWLYVAFVIDVFARRIVGWRVSSSMRTDFVLDALEQALYARQPEQGSSLVHHSDRGSQYVSIRYSERLGEAGIEPSVGSKGDSYDNALAETINGLYKAELIHRRAPWKSKEAVELATLEWVAWFNHHRLLEPIGYIPPVEAEANYYRQLASQTAMMVA